MKGWESPPPPLKVKYLPHSWNGTLKLQGPPFANHCFIRICHSKFSLRVCLLVGIRKDDSEMTERACLLKKGGRGWRIRCQPLTVSATSPAFPIYPEKVCLAEEVDGRSTWSGVSSVSLFIQKSWSGSVVLGSTLGSSYKAVAICGAHWGTLLEQRVPESFVEFTSGLWTLIFLSQTLS